MITAIKIKKRFKSRVDLAYKYYKMLFILNDLRLHPLDIKIIAYTALNGNIFKAGAREKCAEIFDSTYTSVSKNISKLIRQGYLVKNDRKALVNPQLWIDFNNSILLQLNIDCE